MARILLVDDDEDVRKALRQVLERTGHVVCEGEDGTAVLPGYRSFAPDLVLLDVFMPRKDGLEALRELRAEFPGARVVAMSGRGAHPNFEPLRAALALGADAALVKPFELRDLDATIERVLGLR